MMSDDIYGGTFREVNEVLTVNGIEYDSIDLSDIDLFEKLMKRIMATL